MLRTRSGLSRPVLKWVSQVAASLGATLSATLIWSAVPHPGAASGAPSAAQAVVQPELTSGGKFAARAVHPIAYDGLDTMPLPHVAPPPAGLVATSFVAASFDAAPPRATRRAAWDEPAAPERRAPRPARAQAQTQVQARAEARRGEPAAASEPAAVPPTASAAAASIPVAPEPADEGIIHRVLSASLPASLGASLPSIVPGIASTAREAWAVTASAGDALVARVAPRMP